jgi:hypothetical protein
MVVTAGLLAASPAVAQPSATSKHDGPSARAAGGGGGGPLIYPSIVNVRLVRAQAALDRAIAFADEHQPNQAAASLSSGRSNLRKAWTAAKYVIDTAPPPVAAAGRFHESSFRRSGRLRLRKTGYRMSGRIVQRVTAHKAGTAPSGSGIASMYDTAFAVLSLQHLYAATATGMIDTAHSTLLSGLGTTLFAALNGRDTAIAYLHSIDTPPPAAAGRVTAHAAGTPVAVSGWGTVMPNLTPLVDDEIQQVEGTLKTPALRAGTKRVLNSADVQDIKAERTLNQFWPPAPVGAG